MPAKQASPKKASRRARARPAPAVLDETPRQGSASFCSKCSRLFEQADANNTLCPSCAKRQAVRAKAAAKLDSQARPRPTLDVHRASANPAVHTDSERSVKAAEKKTPGSVSRTPFQEDREPERQQALRMSMEDMLLDHSLLEGSEAAEADEPAFATATASVLLHLRRENRALRRRLAAQSNALFSAPRSEADVSLATDPEDALEPAGVRELRQRLNALLRQPPRSARAEEELWKVGEAVDAVSGGWGGSRRREARWRGVAMIEQSACAVVTQELHLVDQMLGSLQQALDWSAEQLAISRAEARELRQREQLCQVRAIAAEAARSDAQLQALTLPGHRTYRRTYHTCTAGAPPASRVPLPSNPSPSRGRWTCSATRRCSSTTRSARCSRSRASTTRSSSSSSTPATTGSPRSSEAGVSPNPNP